MDEYIKRDSAIALIEEKQKELCPWGRYGRNYVYGSDRERYDNWEEIIDALKAIPPDDVALVRHGQWIDKPTGKHGQMQSWCTACREHNGIGGIKTNRHKPYCPNCGALMDLED